MNRRVRRIIELLLDDATPNEAIVNAVTSMGTKEISDLMSVGIMISELAREALEEAGLPPQPQAEWQRRRASFRVVGIDGDGEPAEVEVSADQAATFLGLADTPEPDYTSRLPHNLDYPCQGPRAPRFADPEEGRRYEAGHRGIRNPDAGRDTGDECTCPSCDPGLAADMEREGWAGGAA